MDYATTIKDWIRSDEESMRALQLASALRLDDWCIAAGFVRNLVWDKLHEKAERTPLTDIDLIYFDPFEPRRAKDEALERVLKQRSRLPWSVKNQARMHIRNHDAPYTSTLHAMSYWVELETAIGVRLSHDHSIELLAPFGLARLFACTMTLNPKSGKADAFQRRIADKNWLSQWPALRINNSLSRD